MISHRLNARVFEAIIAGSLLLGSTMPLVHAQGRLQGTTDVAGRPRPGAGSVPDDQESVTIRHKLASIIIPNIEFHSTTLADAIEYLRQEARRLDPDPDPAARGVNIFLKLPAAGQAAASRSVASSLDSVSLGLPVGTGTGSGTAASALPVPSASTRITLTLSRIPLLEALKYLATQAELKVRIEPYAVSLVPLAEDSDTMITTTFRVPPNFIGNASSSSGKTALDEPAAPAH